MTHFPIILIPVEIQRVLRQLPDRKALQEKLPRPPGVEPQPINSGRVLLEGLILIFVAGAISGLNRIFGTVILLVGLVTIFLRMHLQIATYKGRLTEYNARVESYFKTLAAYSQKEGQHQQSIAISHLPEKLAEFRRPLLLAVLSRISAPEITPDIPQDKSAQSAQKDFYHALDRSFPTKIHTGMKLDISPNPYSPLFTYFDASINLYISIEVDSPSNDRGEPTHYRNSLDDQRDNQSLLNLGWLVVRFSLVQASQTPQSCCKSIAKLIYDLTGDLDLLLKFNEVDDLVPMRQWTEIEARKIGTKRDD